MAGDQSGRFSNAHSTLRMQSKEPHPQIAAGDPPVPEQLIDVKAAAHFLGVRVSWVYSAAAEGRIPHHFVGRYLRFRLGELEEWLQGIELSEGGGEVDE